MATAAIEPATTMILTGVLVRNGAMVSFQNSVDGVGAKAVGAQAVGSSNSPCVFFSSLPPFSAKLRTACLRATGLSPRPVIVTLVSPLTLTLFTSSTSLVKSTATGAFVWTARASIKDEHQGQAARGGTKRPEEGDIQG